MQTAYRFVGGIALVATLVGWAGCTDPTACEVDSECFEGQFCASGKCVERPDDGPDVSGRDAEEPPEDTGGESAPEDTSVERDTRAKGDGGGGGDDTTIDPPDDTGGGSEDTATGKPDGGTYRFIDVAAGYRHSCGLLDDGRVYCWGRPETSTDRVPEGERFKSIQAGGTVTCGRTTNDRLVCWGWRNGEPHRDGSPPDKLAPGALYALGRAGSSTAFGKLCVQPSAGSTSVDCYEWYQGNDQRVTGQGPVEDLCADREYACVSTDRGLSCDSNSSFPPGKKEERTVPKDPARLACSYYFVCAVGAGGAVNCFGDYTGPGEDLEAPSGSYDRIVSGDRWACARESGSQTLKCWGSGETAMEAPNPKNTPSGAVSELAGGAKHACAVFDGEILCWGTSSLGRTAAPSAGEAARRLSQ